MTFNCNIRTCGMGFYCRPKAFRHHDGGSGEFKERLLPSSVVHLQQWPWIHSVAHYRLHLAMFCLLQRRHLRLALPVCSIAFWTNYSIERRIYVFPRSYSHRCGFLCHFYTHARTHARRHTQSTVVEWLVIVVLCKYHIKINAQNKNQRKKERKTGERRS